MMPGLAIPFPFGVPLLTPATWNSADKTAALVLSNGDRTATSGSNNDGVRATVGKSSGKWYVEFEQGATTWYNSSQFLHGLAKSGLTLGDELKATTNAIGVRGDMAEVSWSGTTNTLNPDVGNFSAAGGIMMIAIDIDADKFWCGLNGSWAGLAGVAGNPGAGTTPVLTGFGTGPWFPALGKSASGDIIIIRASAVQCAYAAPSGFSYWGS